MGCFASAACCPRSGRTLDTPCWLAGTGWPRLPLPPLLCQSSNRRAMKVAFISSKCRIACCIIARQTKLMPHGSGLGPCWTQPFPAERLPGPGTPPCLALPIAAMAFGLGRGGAARRSEARCALHEGSHWKPRWALRLPRTNPAKVASISEATFLLPTPLPTPILRRVRSAGNNESPRIPSSRTDGAAPGGAMSGRCVGAGGRQLQLFTRSERWHTGGGAGRHRPGSPPRGHVPTIMQDSDKTT